MRVLVERYEKAQRRGPWMEKVSEYDVVNKKVQTGITV